jgi:hypothetical protein
MFPPRHFLIGPGLAIVLDIWDLVGRWALGDDVGIEKSVPSRHIPFPTFDELPPAKSLLLGTTVPASGPTNDLRRPCIGKEEDSSRQSCSCWFSPHQHSRNLRIREVLGKRVDTSTWVGRLSLHSRFASAR